MERRKKKKRNNRRNNRRNSRRNSSRNSRRNNRKIIEETIEETKGKGWIMGSIVDKGSDYRNFNPSSQHFSQYNTIKEQPKEVT